MDTNALTAHTDKELTHRIIRNAFQLQLVLDQCNISEKEQLKVATTAECAKLHSNQEMTEPDAIEKERYAIATKSMDQMVTLVCHAQMVKLQTAQDLNATQLHNASDQMRLMVTVATATNANNAHQAWSQMNREVLV